MNELDQIKKLAGINSCVLADDKTLDSNINDWSGHTRVSLFVDWVKEAMESSRTTSRRNSESVDDFDLDNLNIKFGSASIE
jgi:hypothetical protein